MERIHPGPPRHERNSAEKAHPIFSLMLFVYKLLSDHESVHHLLHCRDPTANQREPKPHPVARRWPSTANTVGDALGLPRAQTPSSEGA